MERHGRHDSQTLDTQHQELAKSANLLNQFRYLVQLRVLHLRCDEDWNVRVGVLPQCEEVLEGFPGFRRVACERGGARQAEVGKRVKLCPIGVLPSTAP